MYTYNHMEHRLHLKLAQEIAEIISSRDVITVIKNRLLNQPEKSFVLDFSSVAFTSRSAAHEFILLEEDLKSHKKQVALVHMNKDVQAMFSTVRHHRIATQKLDFVLPQVMDINVLAA